MIALASLPQRRIMATAGLSWLIVHELQVLLTVLTLPGSLGSRFGHWYFWDAKFYLGIAWSGYQTGAPVALLRAAYFPLYPMLAHSLLLLSVPWQVAMLLVSNSALLAALVLVGLLVYRETGEESAAIWAVLLLAASPLGVFLSGMYPDSLFIALVAGAFLAARSGHWRMAGIVLALALITRPFGILLAVALLLEGLRQRQQWRQFLWLLGPSIVTGGLFLLVLWQTYGSPLVTFSVERHNFSHVLIWPWQTLWLAAQQIAAAGWIYARLHLLIDLAPVLLVVLVAILMAKKWPLSFTVYLSLVAFMCLVSPIIYPHGAQDALASDGRYCYAAAPLLLIPLSCWLTHWPPVARSGLLGLSLVAQLLLVSFELHGGWLV